MTVSAAVLMVLVAGAWWEVGIGVAPLFSGLGNIVAFAGRTVPPEFPDLGHTITLAVETACMAVLGTALAVVLSVPVGFLAARNTTPHPTVRWLARAILVACRSVPDLVFAIVFVEAVGIGVLPGVLALAFHSVGMLGKLYAESIEECPSLPGEAVASTGSTRLQGITASITPQVLPSVWSTAIYRLDINLRTSVILGYVGAGGIGFELKNAMGDLQFRQAVGIVVVIFVLIVAMEVLAAAIRRSLIGSAEAFPTRPTERAGIGAYLIGRLWRCRPKRSRQVEFDREQVRPPWTPERLHRAGFLAAATAAIGLSLWDTKIDPVQAVSSMGRICSTVAAYFPPDFTSAGRSLASGTLQSASVALVATTVGVVFAIPIGLLAARNVTNRWVYRTTRLFLLVVRAVPELILAIVFVVAVGLGLVAGAFALMVGTVGFMSKLIADGIEEVSPGPREAVLSVGATRVQETASSVVAPNVPFLVANGLFMLDTNFRSSTILGIVGAGGIGYLLQQSVQVLAYRTTGAIIVSTFAVVLLVELITNFVRRHVL